jgi:HEAT repeat protein
MSAAPLALLGYLTCFAALALFTRAIGLRQRREAHRAAAALLGFRQYSPGLGFFSKSIALEGTAGESRVEVGEFLRDKQWVTRVAVDGGRTAAGPIPPALHLQLKRDVLFSSGGDLTGDQRFDDEVKVGGGRALALAVLDQEARDAFLAACTGSTPLVEDGVTTLEFSGQIKPETVVEQVRRAVALAERLAIPEPGEIPGALARQASGDRHPGVRLAAFETLVAGAGERSVIEAAARTLLADEHPELRLRAAMTLGDEGFATIAGLVRRPPAPRRAGEPEKLWWEITITGGGIQPDETLLQDTVAHDKRRARALAHLVDHHPRERVLPLVREALRAHGPLLVAALAAVTAIGDATDEEAAVAALGSGDEDVRRAAVDALAAVGTAAAVAPLREVIEQHAYELSLRSAVGAAIARIQERLTGAAAGQVSLAPGESAAGQVNLAGDRDSGRVALSEKRDPARSVGERS